MFTTRYQDLDTLIARDKSHKTAAGRARWVAKMVEAGAIRVLAYSDPTPAAAAPAPRILPAAERVVETRTQTPKLVSARIVDDSMGHAWLVGCEHSAECTHRVLVAKYDFRPVDFADPDGPMIKTTYTAPSPRVCGSHARSAIFSR